jgi:hypothetical protein
MSHRMCRECHRLVSESAAACPHCGIGHPVSAETPFAHLRPYGSALLIGVALAWFGGLWFRYQVGQLLQGSTTPPSHSVVPRDPHPGYQSLKNVWVGAALFAREDHRIYVGRVASLSCPYQPASSASVACIQIEFADGQRSWLPWGTAEARFITPRR